jgi:hypothetical protein
MVAELIQNDRDIKDVLRPVFAFARVLSAEQRIEEFMGKDTK